MLLEGLDATITKTATVVAEMYDEDIHIFKPLQFQTQSVMKIATEPLNPSELPKMVSVPPLPMQRHSHYDCKWPESSLHDLGNVLCAVCWCAVSARLPA